MSDSKTIVVPFEGEGNKRAILLLEAAEKLDLPPDVVRTGDGGFHVPEEVEKEAFGGEYAKRQDEQEKAREAEVEEARGTTLKSQPVTEEETEADKREGSDAGHTFGEGEGEGSGEEQRKADTRKRAAKKSTSKSKGE
jgi:hypothetical protein